MPGRLFCFGLPAGEDTCGSRFPGGQGWPPDGRGEACSRAGRYAASGPVSTSVGVAECDGKGNRWSGSGSLADPVVTGNCTGSAHRSCVVEEDFRHWQEQDEAFWHGSSRDCREILCRKKHAGKGNRWSGSGSLADPVVTGNCT